MGYNKDRNLVAWCSWLTHLSVTEETAGSNPVAAA